jgi:hypothetical protein
MGHNFADWSGWHSAWLVSPGFFTGEHVSGPLPELQRQAQERAEDFCARYVKPRRSKGRKTGKASSGDTPARLLDAHKIDEQTVGAMRGWKHSEFGVDSSVRISANDQAITHRSSSSTSCILIRPGSTIHNCPSMECCIRASRS